MTKNQILKNYLIGQENGNLNFVGGLCLFWENLCA